MTIPQKAIDLIVEQEGLDQPYLWPGESSGITIGIGYDIGEEHNFKSDWAGILPDAQIAALSRAIGITGFAAKMMAMHFRGITISMAQAMQVFTAKTLPHYISETLTAFPGIEKLPDVVLGALTSIVYNRGSSMTGPRRAEMREIRAIILGGPRLNYLQAIAFQIRSMKRLWIGSGIEHDMNMRREAEARLIESAAAGTGSLLPVSPPPAKST